ncbi:THAP domain-containing protein 1 B-like [Adelges cooleyi]|uniref:THAP domain-containing protein 1 B-like n=1 Tax=Adelges cooleyi TaxID=133065 RepID=UPI0021807ECD|nr:THAP domain-containing protein 1 B-like [Adelges cooleyi]
MVCSCSAYGCVNRQSSGSDIHFFSFPLKNPTRNEQWIRAVDRKGFVPTQYSKLCSDHFEPFCFYDPPGGSYKVRLHDNAVPTIFSAKKQPSKAQKSHFKPTVCSDDELVQQQSTSVSVEGGKCVEKSEVPLLGNEYLLYSITPLTQSSFIRADENSEVPVRSTLLKSKKRRFVSSSPKTKSNRRSPSKCELKNTIKKLYRQNRTLKRKIRRQNYKISSIEDQLKELKDSKMLNKDSEMTL